MSSFHVLSLAVGSALLVAAPQRGTDAVTIRPGTPLTQAILTLAHGTQTPVGLEIREDPDEPVTLAEPLSLRGLTAEQGLAALLGAGSRYQWTTVGDHAVVVRPLTANRARAGVFMDRPLGSVDMVDSALPDVIDRGIELLAPPFGRALQRSPLTFPASSLMSKTISIEARDYNTFAELLTAAVIRHGATVWIVSYRFINLGEPEPDAVIDFVTFDGSRAGRSVPAHLVAR